MAKGNRALAAEMKKRDEADRAAQQAAATAAATPSAAESQNEKDRAAFFSWRDKGDYRTPPPSLIGLNYGPEAERRRQAEQTAVGTGILGMGAGNADPTALALAKQNLNDTNAEGDANAYQSAISGEDLYQRTGNSQSLMAQDFARKMGLLGNAQSLSEFSSNMRRETTPQSILPQLLSGLIGGASSFFTGGFSSLIPKPSASPAHP